MRFSVLRHCDGSRNENFGEVVVNADAIISADALAEKVGDDLGFLEGPVMDPRRIKIHTVNDIQRRPFQIPRIGRRESHLLQHLPVAWE